jgi:hypothetical protein
MATTKTRGAAAQDAQERPAAGGGAPQGGAVAVKTSGAVALPADLAAELAGEAKDAAAKERPSVSKVSFKSAMMTYMGNPVPGDKLDVILLAVAFRNTWYAGAYDPDNIVNPSCFAISSDGEDMAPHENVKEPVSKTCDGCPKAQWGSAIRDGKPSRGKACKEGRRLIAIPAAVLEADDVEKAIKGAEMAVMDIPVTSVGNYGTYVNALAATMSRPMYTVITTVSLHRDARTQFQVKFTPIEAINDAVAIRALRARLEEAQRIVMTPYDETELQQENIAAQQKAAGKTTKFAGARR